MSLSEALRNKRSRLKHTDTVVTRVDGRRFVETGGSEVLAIADRRYGFVVDTKPDDVPSKITDNIYLGSQDCCEPSVLREYKIANVLSLGVASAFCTAPEVAYKFVECLDLPETNVLDILSEHCVAFIRDAIAKDERVLIHCNAGVSRSSAITIGFLMLEDGLEYSAAYDIVKRARSCIRPNCGFARQLQTLSSNVRTD